ncbi:MAG: tetratricopeptide repeat protein, partial [Armatimonadetes bacterium]|nr:tetratricopeptide repeat protein [Armatimonadota bacterium]NIO97598.1 tetratricopeptide repeat protein [Armatimonadota bacterium]
MYCISRGEYREGLELCALLTEAFPESPRLADVSYWTGDLLASVAAGDPAGQLKAISAYEEAMAIFPSHPLAEATAFHVGELYHGLGFTYETMEAFNRFLEKFPESELVPEARRMRARCMYRAGRYEDAEAEFRSYLEDYPDSPYRPEITLGLADTFFHLGKM